MESDSFGGMGRFVLLPTLFPAFLLPVLFSIRS